jgi:hypothetical protein
MKFMETEEVVDAIMKKETTKRVKVKRKRRISSVTLATDIQRTGAGGGR